MARDGAQAQLAPEAIARNDRARESLAKLLARGDDLYGVSTGVGALRGHTVSAEDRDTYSLRLLRSHAVRRRSILSTAPCRAAMATRANQIGAGGAGVAPSCSTLWSAALNAGSRRSPASSARSAPAT